VKKRELLEHTLYHVYCRLMPSPIHGIGVFAVREIAEGVQPFAGCDRTRAIWVRPEELSGLHPEVRRMVDDFCAVQDGWVYLPRRGLNAIDVQYYVNHSDQPNLVTTDGGSTFHTARNVRVGEELTVDYRTYNDPMP
jgi:SET domain-containing protein